MIIEIKGNQYTDPDFKVDNGIATLRVHSEASFADVVDDFALEAGDEIGQYNDSEEQVGVLYVEGMASIQLPGEDGTDVVTVKYHVSQIGKDAQEALTDDLDMTTFSVLELAGILSQAKRSFENTAARVESGLTEQGERITTMRNTVDAHTATISHWETMYNALADRVAALENKGV